MPKRNFLFLKNLHIVLSGIFVGLFFVPDLFAQDTPKDDEYYLRGGMVRYAAGEYQAAVKNLRRFVALKPNNAKGHYRLALALYKMGKKDEALGSFRKAYQLKPSDAGYAEGYAAHAYLMNRNQEAFEPARKSALLQPRSEFAHLILQQVAYHNNDYTMTVQAYERMAELREMEKHAIGKVKELKSATYNQVGISYGVIGDYEAARKVLAEGFRLYPWKKPVSEWFYVFSYCSKGWENARRQWNARPASVTLGDQGLKNIIKYGIRDIAVKAEKEGRQYLSLRHYSLLFSLVYKRARGTYFKDEKELLDKIFSIYKKLPLKPKPPRDALLNAVEAEDYIKKKKWAKAEGSYNEAIALAPWWPDAHFNMALVMFVEFGAQPGAVRELDKYLELAPNGPNASKAREKKREWESVVQEDVARGAWVEEDFPFLLSPDREDW